MEPRASCPGASHRRAADGAPRAAGGDRRRRTVRVGWRSGSRRRGRPRCSSLDGGTVVHEWYADGLDAGHAVPRRLDDQVGAGPPGRTRGPRRRVGVDRRGDRPRPRAGGHGLRRHHRARRPHHDHRRRLGRGPPRPRQPCLAAAGLLRPRNRVACAPARGAARRRARHPVQLLHRRLAGARLGARARHRARVRRRRRPAVGGPRLHPRRGGRGRRCRGRDGRRRAGRHRPRLGAGGPARRGRLAGCSTPTGSRPPRARRTPSWRPAGCRAASPHTPASATTGGRWTPTAGG